MGFSPRQMKKMSRCLKRQPDHVQNLRAFSAQSPADQGHQKEEETENTDACVAPTRSCSPSAAVLENSPEKRPAVTRVSTKNSKCLSAYKESPTMYPLYVAVPQQAFSLLPPGRDILSPPGLDLHQVSPFTTAICANSETPGMACVSA